MATDIQERFGIGSEQNRVVGPDLASGATIAPTHGVHLVTGAAAIATITPPYPTFSGTIVLLAGGIFTWTAGGNIAVAGTSTAVGRSIAMTYNPATAKWYPSAVA